MAYDDPYLDAIDESNGADLPPEAEPDSGTPRVGLFLSIAAGTIALVALLLGIAIGRTNRHRDI